MNNKIILIGGGGHCKSCIDVIESEGKFEIAGIIDNSLKKGETVLEYPVIGNDDDLPEIISKITNNVLITVGQIKSSKLRRTLVSCAKTAGAKFPVIISPFAHVSHNAQIGEGTIVMHQVVINASAHVGSFCIINSQALIEHDCYINNYCHVSTGVKINGDVHIDKDCFLGSASVIYNGISITKSVIVPAGNIVSKNIEISGILKKGIG